MSARDRMIAFHVARLQDKNPEVRLRSIRELVLLEATEALDTLKNIYLNDPDEQVRRQAQQAGRTLYNILKQNPARDNPAS